MMKYSKLRHVIIIVASLLVILLAACANPVGSTEQRTNDSTTSNAPAEDASNDLDNDPVADPLADPLDDPDPQGDAAGEPDDPADEPADAADDTDDADDQEDAPTEAPAVDPVDEPAEDPADDSGPADESGAIQPDSPYYSTNEDGSVSFTQEGLTATGGNSEEFVVAEDGSISIQGNGGRRAYAGSISLSSYRLSIDNARLVDAQGQSSRGWAIVVHGSLTEADEFEGYTVQFDLGRNQQVEIRQWIAGVEEPAHHVQPTAALGLNLRDPMDVELLIEGDRFTLTVNGQTVFDDVQLQRPGRSSGFVGLSAEATTNVEIDALRVLPLP